MDKSNWIYRLNAAIKTRQLRLVAKWKSDKLKKLLRRLTDEQRLIFDISMKIIVSMDSALEISPTTGIYYGKYKDTLLKMDCCNIYLVDEKHHYITAFHKTIIEEMRKIFNRHKERSINYMINEMSSESKAHLQSLFNDLNEIK